MNKKGCTPPDVCSLESHCTAVESGDVEKSTFMTNVSPLDIGQGRLMVSFEPRALWWSARVNERSVVVVVAEGGRKEMEWMVKALVSSMTCDT